MSRAVGVIDAVVVAALPSFLGLRQAAGAAGMREEIRVDGPAGLVGAATAPDHRGTLGRASDDTSAYRQGITGTDEIAFLGEPSTTLSE